MHTDGLQLPGPLALTLRDLDAAIQGKDIGMVAIRLKDVTDTLVRVGCAYALAVYQCRPKREQERDYELLRFLPRPSTGQLINLFGVLLKEVRAGPEPCATMYRLFVETDGGKRYRSLRTLAEYGTAFSTRSSREGRDWHVSSRSSRMRLTGWPHCVDGLDQALRQHPVLCPVSDSRAEVWCGVDSPTAHAGRFSAHEIGRVGFVDGDDRFVSLEPWFLVRTCAECRIRRLFLYESCRSYGTDPARRKLNYQEYDGPHDQAFTDAAEILEQLFGDAVVRRSFLSVGPWARAVLGQLRDSSAVRDVRSEIVGRDSLRHRLDQFIDARTRGVLLLTGEPGIGKTAFLSDFTGQKPDRIGYFFRHDSGWNHPDDCVSYLLGRLIGKYWPGTAWVKLSPQEARAELASVLGGLSAQLRPGEKELLVIDALDEATTASDGFTAAQMIPAAIPEGVFFIVSARRNLPGIEHWSSHGDFEQIELRADLAENRADAYQFVRWKLGERVTEQWVRRLADLARWNFLVLTSVCMEITRADLDPPTAERYLAAGADLDDWYAGFWERLRQRFVESPADLELIESVMGAIAVAGGPVTRNEICELMGGISPFAV